MATQQQLESALIKADAAGDVDGARLLAAEVRKMRSAGAQPAKDPLANLDPTQGMSGVEKFAAGAGKAITDIGRGAGQMLGMVSDERVAESRRLDAPLMKTGAGNAGNIAGTIGVAVPAALIPGANTMVGAALTGAAAGALQPTLEGESRAKNTAIGAVAGVGGKLIGDKAGKMAADKLSKKTAGLATAQSQNATRDSAIKQAREVGYAIPPTQANPSLLNRIVEGVSGKITTSQQASMKNQEVTNLLVKKALGLPDETPITPQALKSLRNEAGQAYEAVKAAKPYLVSTPQYRQAVRSIGNDWSAAAQEFPDLVKNKEIEALVSSIGRQDISTPAAVEIVKKLRFDASVNKRSMDNPAKRELARAQSKAAEAIDDLIDQNLSRMGKGELLSDYRMARQLIAKSHDVENALDETTGNVSARELAKMMDKKFMSGDLKTVASFAKAFPKAAQDVSKMGSTPGFSPLDVGVGTISAFASGSPSAFAAIGARPAARSLAMSRPYQHMLADAPSYRPGATASVPASVLNNRFLMGSIPFLSGQSAVGGNLPQE